MTVATNSAALRIVVDRKRCSRKYSELDGIQNYPELAIPLTDTHTCRCEIHKKEDGAR